MTKQDEKQIAETILRQLGGRKFIAMTGSHSFFYGANGTLSMQLRKNKSRAKYLTIELMGDDTYTLTFKRIWNFETKEVSRFKGVYADQLQEVFERETGLVTNL